KYQGVRPYITGHDLHALGLHPGPGFKRILTEVLQARLNGRIRNKTEELALVKDRIRRDAHRGI
ncbi:MAG: CCA tRNA nucleotidyltransferase, partial [Candidatus Omnitrophica bacterium]|nr:CCA tRNA nucleotidyltransferase [Candidatus Omnitrophota bacterium]